MICFICMFLVSIHFSYASYFKVYATNENQEVTFGSVESLINHINNADPLKIIVKYKGSNIVASYTCLSAFFVSDPEEIAYCYTARHSFEITSTDENGVRNVVSTSVNEMIATSKGFFHMYNIDTKSKKKRSVLLIEWYASQ